MSSALALLADWLPHQRWFTVTGRPPRLRLLADVPIEHAAADDDARVRLLIVADDAAPRPLVY